MITGRKLGLAISRPSVCRNPPGHPFPSSVDQISGIFVSILPIEEEAEIGSSASGRMSDSIQPLIPAKTHGAGRRLQAS
jgi:hypothetical protein